MSDTPEHTPDEIPEKIIPSSLKYSVTQGAFIPPESHGGKYSYERLFTITGNYADMQNLLTRLLLDDRRESGFADKPGCHKTRLDDIVPSEGEITVRIRVHTEVDSPTAARVNVQTNCLERAVSAVQSTLRFNGASAEPVGQHIS